MHLACILNIQCTYAFILYTLLIQLYNSICKYMYPIGSLCYIVCIHIPVYTHVAYTYSTSYTVCRPVLANIQLTYTYILSGSLRLPTPS